MRRVNAFKWIVAAGGLVLSSGLAMGQARHWESRDRYDRQDLREDYRDIQHDYTQVDRLRADIARDQQRLNMAVYYGNRWEADRIARDIARDRRALNALLRDIGRDRRDIRRDERNLYREGDYWRWR